MTISIHTDDQAEIKKNLNKAIEEQNSEAVLPEEYQEFYDAAKKKMRCRSFTMRSAPWKK